MAFVNKFELAPPAWLPLQNRALLDRIPFESYYDHQGKHFEHPDFELKIVPDVHNFFAADLFARIRRSHVEGTRLVVILPSPENAVFISVAEALNKWGISCRNVHVFFLYEYANEHGQVAPWQSPYSRSGHFMRYFYQRLDAALRMPMEQIHFFKSGSAEACSDELAALGGADVAYTALSWAGGIGAIDAQTFPAQTMETFLAMGSRCVTVSPEFTAHESLRGMFGCSGDIWNTPPCAATVGPRDLAAARERVDVEYLTACGGQPAHQKLAGKLALFGPVAPDNPGSMLRLYPGVCYVAEDVAREPDYEPDEDWLGEKIEEIRAKEAAGV